MVPFDWSKISDADREIALKYIGGSCTAPALMRAPDISFLPGYEPQYQFRWYVNTFEPDLAGNIFFHIMTGNDPTDQLHDHSWDNCSVILAGQMRESLTTEPEAAVIKTAEFNHLPGDVIWRNAKWAHRVGLPPGISYCMTLFLIGPKIRSNMSWSMKPKSRLILPAR